jgi:hypothetical protein
MRMIQGYDGPLGEHPTLYLGIQSFSALRLQRLPGQMKQTIHHRVLKTSRIRPLRSYLIPLKEDEKVFRVGKVRNPAGLPEGERGFLQALPQRRA